MLASLSRTSTTVVVVALVVIIPSSCGYKVCANKEIVANSRAKCKGNDVYVQEGLEAAQIVHTLHEQVGADHMMLFPGHSPSWIMQAMEVQGHLPCKENKFFCGEWFALSSDPVRLMVNHMAALTFEKYGKRYRKPVVANILVQEGIVKSKNALSDSKNLASKKDLQAELHPNRLTQWVQKTLCKYFDEKLDLKKHIVEQKIVVIDHTSSGLSVLGLALVFKECRRGWEGKGKDKPVKFINLIDHPRGSSSPQRICWLPHSLNPDILQTVGQVAMVSLMQFVGDDTVFGRWVPSCGIQHISKPGFCSHQASPDALMVEMFRRVAKKPCQLKKVEKLHPVMFLPSFDWVAGPKRKGKRNTFQEAAGLVDKMKATDSCASDCIQFMKQVANEILKGNVEEKGWYDSIENHFVEKLGPAEGQN